VRQIAIGGVQALKAQCRLSRDASDDDAWNDYALEIRTSLKRTAEISSKTMDDVLAKALLLALTIGPEGEIDHRYALAQSVIADIEAFPSIPLNQQKSQRKR
jgi:hypothetical protein